MSKYLDCSGIDIILVGDSLGQVIKGEKTTHGVTLDEITYHTRCVKSGLKTSILMVDLPKNSFNTKSKAFKNSQKFILKRLADLIKIEVDTNYLHIAQYLIEKNPAGRRKKRPPGCFFCYLGVYNSTRLSCR